MGALRTSIGLSFSVLVVAVTALAVSLPELAAAWEWDARWLTSEQSAQALVFAPTGLMIVLAVATVVGMSLGWSTARRGAGELLYFLGYLSTITSLVTWAFLVGEGYLSQTDVTAVLRALSIALLTTIVGLIALTALPTFEAPGVHSERPEDSGPGLPPLRRVDSLAVALHRLSKELEAVTRTAGGSAKTLTEFANAGQALKGLNFDSSKVKQVTDALAAVGDLQEYATSLKTSLRSVGDGLEKVSRACDALETPLDKDAQKARDLEKAISELSDVLDKFSRMTSKRLDEGTEIVTRSDAERVLR